MVFEEVISFAVFGLGLVTDSPQFLVSPMVLDTRIYAYGR